MKWLWMNPYTAGAAALVGLIVVLAIGNAGHRMGVKAEAKRVAPVIEQLTAANESLTARVREVEAAMREANAKVAEEAARAREAQAQGEIAAAQAQEATRAMRQRAATLEQQLKAERAGCHEGEARICGVPLR
ncbi:hypothetical protein MASR1M8_15790 [Thermomonas brevis]